MRRGHAGALPAAVLALLVRASGVMAAPAPAPEPAQPPRLLNIVHVRIKPGSASPYATLEALIVRAYQRAKVKLYWVALQSMRDPNDVLYLNLYDSKEAADGAEGIYQDAVKRHPELVPLQQRLAGMTLSTASTMTTRRDDIDHPPVHSSFETMRRLRVATIQVAPGREGAFLDALRTAPSKDGAWFVYEANEASTYALVTPKDTPFTRTDGPAVPRALRRSEKTYTKAETRVYAVRLSMSHVRPAAVRAGGTARD